MIITHICKHARNLRRRSSAALLSVLLAAVPAAPAMAQHLSPVLRQADLVGLPRRDLNQSQWYRFTKSDTVFVFVHGVLSNVLDCWLNQGDATHDATYWPELVAKDSATFAQPGIYLGGYATSPASGIYDISNAAEDLFANLSYSPPNDTGSVMRRPNIVFIAHSLGGLVVRQMLVHHRPAFRGHSVGLLLIASPTLGSEFANSLGFLETILNHKVGEQLQVGGQFITTLDQDFRNLIASQEFPLHGAEFCENHLIVSKWLGLGSNTLVVPPYSCTVYFGFNGYTRILANTDHFSTVKPDSRSHPSYRALVEFIQQEFTPLAPRDTVAALVSDVILSPTLFQRNPVSRNIAAQVDVADACGTSFTTRAVSHIPGSVQARSANYVITGGNTLVRNGAVTVNGDSISIVFAGQLPAASPDGTCERRFTYTVVAAADSFTYTPLSPLHVKVSLTPSAPTAEFGVNLDSIAGIPADAELLLAYSAEVTGRTPRLGAVALDFRSDAAKFGVRMSTSSPSTVAGRFRASKILIDATSAFAKRLGSADRED